MFRFFKCWCSRGTVILNCLKFSNQFERMCWLSRNLWKCQYAWTISDCHLLDKESSFTLLVPFSLPLCRIEPVKFLISIAIWERIWYIHLTLFKPAYSFCSFVIREPKTALAQETISGVTQVLLDNSTKSQLAAMLEGNSTKDDV